MRSVARILPLPVSANEPPVLEARGLGIDARGRTLLDGIDIGLRPGRRAVILGANGAGKSLLLRALHGLDRPTRGDILCFGRPLDRVARRRQAMVFQRPVLLRRSVRANLAFALAVRGVPRNERAQLIDEGLDRAQLAHLAHRPARLLSGGEQQRLALARALACRPEVLLLDEPTASLDPAATLAVERLLGEAHREGVTCVLVTHDAGQARRMGDDLIFLHAGRVAEAGVASDLLARPRSEPLRAWLDGRLYLDPVPPTESHE